MQFEPTLRPNAVLLAQEVKFVDLIATGQRVLLRFPSAPRVQNGGGGTIGQLIAEYGTDERQPKSLIVSLENAISRHLDTQRTIEAEFKVRNTGQVPLALPVSPNLSDS
jgi:hypothetical protein